MSIGDQSHDNAALLSPTHQKIYAYWPAIVSSPSNSSAHEKWERLVGKAILKFGDIELISIKCLSIIPSDRLDKSTAGLEFGRRASLIVEILEGRDDLCEHQITICVGMKKAKVLAKTRNLIAHNPVMLDLFVNEDETEAVAQHSIKSVRSEQQTLDLEGLEEFAAEVEMLSAKLWLAFLNIAKTSDHLWRVMS